VGPVEPVKLGEVQRGHVAPARGTGGTGVGWPGAGVKIFLPNSTGSTSTHPRCCRVLRRSSVLPNVFMDDKLSIVSSADSSKLRP
jgi:hypothetical protein